ncbi:hypothetical protein BGX38DRAFT_1162612 [Terfezia claveryi]|nr:hypothetical protein BGX38DRAFT_1162612 [Terfezia claveryi]
MGDISCALGGSGDYRAGSVTEIKGVIFLVQFLVYFSLLSFTCAQSFCDQIANIKDCKTNIRNSTPNHQKQWAVWKWSLVSLIIGLLLPYILSTILHWDIQEFNLLRIRGCVWVWGRFVW